MMLLNRAAGCVPSTGCESNDSLHNSLKHGTRLLLDNATVDYNL